MTSDSAHEKVGFYRAECFQSSIRSAEHYLFCRLYRRDPPEVSIRWPRSSNDMPRDGFASNSASNSAVSRLHIANRCVCQSGPRVPIPMSRYTCIVDNGSLLHLIPGWKGYPRPLILVRNCT